MLYAVILAGGRGTRFWPLSRRARPKQCISLDGGPTLIQRTVERVLPLVPVERILVVTGPDMLEAVREQLPGLPAGNLLVEPSPRNTAPAAAWTAWEVARRDPDATICVLPSDHAITDEPAFRECLRVATAAAAEGGVVVIGIRPTRPETGFGYIEPETAATGDASAAGDTGHASDATPAADLRPRPVRTFLEKPDAATAERLIAAGCLWNAGMFCWRASTVIDVVRRCLPATAVAMDRLLAGDRAAWTQTDATSVDYGILERIDGIRVVPGDFGWSDVGSWPALAEVLPAQAWGWGPAEVEAVRAEGNVVYSADRLVALLGVDDLIVVDTPDVLLVAHRREGQRVKEVLDAVERRRPGHS